MNYLLEIGGRFRILLDGSLMQMAAYSDAGLEMIMMLSIGPMLPKSPMRHTEVSIIRFILASEAFVGTL